MHTYIRSDRLTSIAQLRVTMNIIAANIAWHDYRRNMWEKKGRKVRWDNVLRDKSNSSEM